LQRRGEMDANRQFLMNVVAESKQHRFSWTAQPRYHPDLSDMLRFLHPNECQVPIVPLELLGGQCRNEGTSFSVADMSTDGLETRC